MPWSPRRTGLDARSGPCRNNLTERSAGPWRTWGSAPAWRTRAEWPKSRTERPYSSRGSNPILSAVARNRTTASVFEPSDRLGRRQEAKQREPLTHQTATETAAAARRRGLVASERSGLGAGRRIVLHGPGQRSAGRRRASGPVARSPAGRRGEAPLTGDGRLGDDLPQPRARR